MKILKLALKGVALFIVGWALFSIAPVSFNSLVKAYNSEQNSGPNCGYWDQHPTCAPDRYYI